MTGMEDHEKVENYFVALLNAMSVVTEHMRGSKPGVILTNSEGLFIKVFEHALSLLYLFRGIRIPEVFHGRTFDFPSINVLSRVVMESYLRFHYIFVNPEDVDEQSLRYYIWKWAAAKVKLKRYVPMALDQEHISIAEHEEDEYRNNILKNKAFIRLSKKDQRNLMNERRPVPPAWQLAEMAGIDVVTFQSQYAYTSGHAHGDAHNVKQVHITIDPDERAKLTEIPMGFAMIAMANMVKDTIKLFELNENILNGSAELKSAVDLFVYLGTINTASNQ